MSEKEKKKEEGKKAKGEGEGDKEGKEGKSEKKSKEGSDAKSKKEKDSGGGKEGGKKNAGAKDGEAKGGAGKENGDKKSGEVLASPDDPNALPALDADGNPICVQPDPPPTFAELWFDDPVEGEAAQKLALELKSRIELRALPIRKFLEGAIVPLLLQGLQHMVLERPTNPAEYLAAFLLRNNPLKDKQYVEPPVIPPATQPPPMIEPPKCACCLVHCPPPEQEVVPDFFRKNSKVDKTDAPKRVSQEKSTARGVSKELKAIVPKFDTL